jgi:hypothetical protein
LKDLEEVKKIYKDGKTSMIKYLEMIEIVAETSYKIIYNVERLPENADKRQKKFIKNSNMTERIMEGVCDNVKEAKEVKKEAKEVKKEAKEVKKEAEEIIKTLARKAESPWETIYFEYKTDKDDPWVYKIVYCSLENGVCVEQRCWPYRGFKID